MAEGVTTSYAGAEAYRYLLRQPAHKPAQHLLAEGDIIRNLRSHQMDSRNPDALQDMLSCSNVRILERIEVHEDANDIIQRVRDRDTAEQDEKSEAGE
jgi:hypothetical protein